MRVDMQASNKKQLFRSGVYGIVVVEGEILLVRQPKGPYAGKLDLPGGGIEWGENPEQALRREFKEEVGGGFGEWQLFDNLSTVVETTDYMFHQLGLIYTIYDFCPAAEISIAELEFGWYGLAGLTKDQLSPFAYEIVKRCGH